MLQTVTRPRSAGPSPCACGDQFVGMHGTTKSPDSRVVALPCACSAFSLSLYPTYGGAWRVVVAPSQSKLLRLTSLGGGRVLGAAVRSVRAATGKTICVWSKRRGAGGTSPLRCTATQADPIRSLYFARTKSRLIALSHYSEYHTASIIC
jgi:hypothetical protein